MGIEESKAIKDNYRGSTPQSQLDAALLNKLVKMIITAEHEYNKDSFRGRIPSATLYVDREVYYTLRNCHTTLLNIIPEDTFRGYPVIVVQKDNYIRFA